MSFDISPYRHLYPFQSRWLHVRGHRYHYVDEGRGEPIVLVHGNPTWSFFFRSLIRELREDHRVIAMDHIGCGLSDKPGDDEYDYCLQRRIDDLDALLEHLQLTGNLTFGVHDWGGMIGLGCALHRVEHVKRLMVFNTTAFLPPAGKRLPFRLAMVRNCRPLAAVAVRGLNAFSYLATRMACVKPMPKEVSAAYRGPYDSWAHRIATLRFVQDIPSKPGDRSDEAARWVDENLQRFRELPTLICWGLRDFVFDGDYLAEWRRRFPNAQVHAFEDAGHYVLEDKGPEICSLARAFLDEHPGSKVEGRRSKVKGRKVGTLDFRPWTLDLNRQSSIVNRQSLTSSEGRNKAPAQRGARKDSRTSGVNIADRLTAVAERLPNKKAVVWPVGRDAAGNARYHHLTFAELCREVDRFAEGLERAGITRGTRTIVFVKPGAQFFALVFALFKVGAVPVMIDPGIGKQQMRSCLSEVEAEAFIGTPLAHVFRMLYPRAFKSVKVWITVGRRWFWGGLRLSDVRADPALALGARIMAPTRAGDPAAILFTSGSTGPAKGVLYTHGVFDAQVRYLESHFGFSEAETDLPTFPLFALFDAALGITAVIPDMDFTRPGAVDPRRIIEPIRDHRLTQMFGSPALLDRLSRYGQANGITLPTLRRVITAGAPVAPAVLERMAAMLRPGAEIHTPYGATEALPVASIASSEILGDTARKSAQGAGTCVGKPLPGIDVRIIRIDDEPIREWTDDLEVRRGDIGEIVVRGSVVTTSYVSASGARKDSRTSDRPGATELAKIVDGDGIWHRMGDVGYFDECGRLWFCGRRAHRVITEAGTMFTVPCEAILNEHPLVYRSALVGVGPAGAQRPVICVELERGAERHEGTKARRHEAIGQSTIRNPQSPIPNRQSAIHNPQSPLTRQLLQLAASNELTRQITTVLYHPSLPVDVRHNSKIFREKLAVWAQERLR
ncbi:MAG: fatty acid CoA ligase family protein [Phycisphaerae bacterium]